MGFRCFSRTRTVTGGFGAVDQIYPHELAHVIYQQLAGARPPAYTSQIHAAGVRTDPITAFDEGFASHLQAMAIDHPDAAPETHALAQNTGYQAVQQRLDQYRKHMASHMLSTEGVISTLFYRWATDPALQNTYRDEAFYTQFGTSRADLLPADNVYLKLFHTFAVKKPRTAVELIRGYIQLFPDEAEAVDRGVSVVLLGQPLPEHPEIWLANRGFQVGVTLFDQFRRDSHLHTFDLNAASLVDLLGVPGVDRPLAEAILQGAPYITLDDLQRVPGMTPAVMKQFRSMAEGMDRPDHVMDTLLVSLGWYALSFMLLAGSLGGLAYWLVLRVRWWRALLNGLAIAVFSLLPGWVISGWMDLVLPLAPVLLFGVPAALWRLRRKRGSLGTGRQTLLAWGLAVIPALLLVHLRL